LDIFKINLFLGVFNASLFLELGIDKYEYHSFISIHENLHSNLFSWLTHPLYHPSRKMTSIKQETPQVIKNTIPLFTQGSPTNFDTLCEKAREDGDPFQELKELADSIFSKPLREITFVPYRSLVLFPLTEEERLKEMIKEILDQPDSIVNAVLPKSNIPPPSIRKDIFEQILGKKSITKRTKKSTTRRVRKTRRSLSRIEDILETKDRSKMTYKEWNKTPARLSAIKDDMSLFVVSDSDSE
jgi:hypothetical protein